MGDLSSDRRSRIEKHAREVEAVLTDIGDSYSIKETLRRALKVYPRTKKRDVLRFLIKRWSRPPSPDPTERGFLIQIKRQTDDVPLER